MWMPFIYPKLGEVFTKWFDDVGKLDEVRGLFLSTVYKRSFSVENRYLTLMRALEAYSRAKQLPPPLPPKPNGREQRFSLEERLTAVMETLESETVELFCSKPKVFRERIILVRDYHTGTD